MGGRQDGTARRTEDHFDALRNQRGMAALPAFLNEPLSFSGLRRLTTSIANQHNVPVVEDAEMKQHSRPATRRSLCLRERPFLSLANSCRDPDASPRRRLPPRSEHEGRPKDDQSKPDHEVPLDRL